MSSYVQELSDYLAEFTARCRAARWLGALFHVRVCADIVDDINSTEQKAAALAYTAEQADLEAMKELHAALADGLDKSDEPAVKRALANLGRSAKNDRSISSLLTA